MPCRLRTGLQVLPKASRHRSIGRKSDRVQRHSGQTITGDRSNGPTATLIDRLPDTTIPINRSGRGFSPTRFWLTGATTPSVPIATHVRRAAKPKTLYVLIAVVVVRRGTREYD